MPPVRHLFRSERCDAATLATCYGHVERLAIFDSLLDAPTIAVPAMPALKSLSLYGVRILDPDAFGALIDAAPNLECIKIQYSAVAHAAWTMLSKTRAPKLWYLSLGNVKNRSAQKIDLSETGVTAMHLSECECTSSAFALPLGLRTLDVFECDELDPACLEPLRLLRHIFLTLTGTDIEIPTHVWATLRVLGCPADRVPIPPSPFPAGPPIDVFTDLLDNEEGERGYLRRLAGMSRRIRRITVMSQLDKGTRAFPVVIGGVDRADDDDDFENITDLDYELRRICPKARIMHCPSENGVVSRFSKVCRVCVDPEEHF